MNMKNRNLLGPSEISHNGGIGVISQAINKFYTIYVKLFLGALNVKVLFQT